MADLDKVIRSLEICTSDIGECIECPYHEKAHLASCRFDLSVDALSMLKAQMPRLMTLEEVQQMGKRNMKRNDLPYETCICEIRPREGLHICSPFWNEPRFEGDESSLDIQFEYMGTDEYDVIPVRKYGWYVRCWTSTPSKEQKEAAPWL